MTDLFTTPGALELALSAVFGVAFGAALVRLFYRWVERRAALVLASLVVGVVMGVGSWLVDGPAPAWHGVLAAAGTAASPWFVPLLKRVALARAESFPGAGLWRRATGDHGERRRPADDAGEDRP